MRVVIDMQGAQSASQSRCIGRYIKGLVWSLVHHQAGHEIFLAFNGTLEGATDAVIDLFRGILPPENIRIWDAPPRVAGVDPANDWRRRSAELVREAFLDSLHPDIVLIASFFEGLDDDIVTSIPCEPVRYPTAVVLYDLAPLVHEELNLEDPSAHAWYLEKIAHLRRASLCLAISETTRQEAVVRLDLADTCCINISVGTDERFRPAELTVETKRGILDVHGLRPGFVMCTGGIDHPKNVEGLIRAFAKLSPALRALHPLAIVCSMPDVDRKRLLELGGIVGLQPGEMVFTGPISVDGLVVLYNSCGLFVLPTWHKGFCLPALEAMRCGAPVIAANTSSLYEVEGLPEALFDPHDDCAMARSIERALTDNDFCDRLRQRGELQAAMFSWDSVAQCAIAAMERITDEHRSRPAAATVRPRLAYVSPLPPDHSGIADYSAELLPVLAQYYEIDVVVPSRVDDAWILANCPIRSVEWFGAHSHEFDRVLYHFGNSEFHQHMFALLRVIPGVVVLHDFYLSGVVQHMDSTGYERGGFAGSLLYSHGYVALAEYSRTADVAGVVNTYPCNRQVLEGSIGLIAHSKNSVQLCNRWYGRAEDMWSVLPLLRAPAPEVSKEEARRSLGIPSGGVIVCSFGLLGPSKLNHRLLQAWIASGLAGREDCHLYFVGANHPGSYGREFSSTMQGHVAGSSVVVTGWVTQEVYRLYLAAADIGVQLRTLSRGETSAAALDCMNYGLATIVNAHGSMADLPDDAVFKLPDDFSNQQLAHALELLALDASTRRRIGDSAKHSIHTLNHPAHCAQLYHAAIERSYKIRPRVLPALLQSIAKLAQGQPSESDLVSVSNAVARTFPPPRVVSQLLVDVSALVRNDIKTGVQRVVRNILREWLLHPPNDYRIEPVYATSGGVYRYARRFVLKFLDIAAQDLEDDALVDYAPDDIFFVLDLYQDLAISQRGFLQALRRRGVRVLFTVYDLLPIQMPQFFISGMQEMHARWLEVVAEGDGALCISKAVADEMRALMRDRGVERQQPFQIEWFHLGADMDSVSSGVSLPSGADEVLTRLRSRPSFLMVGTLEPRKGHAQVLGAVELLWNQGCEVNLVIVGKHGWLVEELAHRLKNHPSRGKRLFWLEGVEDAYLEQVYAASACLIAASYGEGFGLPLIEAAQHGLPLIARDLPVFREVAGDHAYFFQDASSQGLADILHNWLALYERNQHPSSSGMSWLTWEQSARQLLKSLLMSPELVCHGDGRSRVSASLNNMN